jgi:hypothetical protein
MVIGKSYDFRSLEVNNSGDLPESSLTAPQSIDISSRFEVDKEKVIDIKNVTLDSIKDGEIITTTDPDFFGVGPQGTSIEISVESELQEAVLSTDSKGKWNWSPPVDLEQGDHKITLKWRDANGVLRTITKSFVVAASEGPAFESTPSATPLVEATASPSSTPATTPTVVATAKSTAAPTPETGSLLPTVGLFIMGIGILLSSHYIWNKSNAY